MKKRIFGTLLMGALFVSSMSTLVSCKDYDDDINSLQGQVNSLSSRVDQKETAIQSLVNELDAAYKRADSDLKTAYEQADAALKKGYQDADASIVNGYTDGDVATLAAAKTAIENAKTALEATIQSNYETLEAKDKAQDVAISQAQADASAALAVLPTKADVTDLTAAVARIANLESKASSLDTDLQKAIKDIETLQTAIKAQESALTVVQQLVSDNAAAIANNKTDIANVRSELTAGLASAAADLETAKTTLQAAITSVENSVNETNSTLAAEITKVNTTIENVRTEVLAQTTIIDTKYEVITVMISKALRSLVYMPTLYVDGIETIEYNWLRDSLLNRTNVASWTRTEGATPTKTIDGVTDYVLPATVKDFVYGPAWPVYYHQNPSVASTAYKNIVGYYAYDVETMTRATDMPDNCKTVWGITSPEKYYNGDQLFKGGAILTAGLQIAKPHLLDNVKDNNRTSYTTHPNLHSNNNVIVALQASSDINGKDTVITSDYAMLYPEKVWIEGLVWKKGTETNDFPTYWYKDNTRIKNFWDNDRGYAGVNPYRTATPSSNYANRDEDCDWLAANKKIHVWNTPQEALNNPADIELFVDDADGINILQYIGVHFVHEAQTKAGTDRHPGTWAWNDDELKHFGLRWYLDVVDYTVTDRTRPEQIIRTHDSRYVKFQNPVLDANSNEFANNTTIVAQDVIDRDGLNETYDDAIPTDGSRASVGREPLLRIRLYHGEQNERQTDAYDKGPKYPILDGYIRVRISKPELKELEYPKFQNETFDLCNALTKETNWTLFNQKVLAEGLDLEREQFNALYAADYKTGSTTVLKQYSKPRNYSELSAGDQGAEFYGYYFENGRAISRTTDNIIAQGEVGTIEYRDNYQGTTNDAFTWVISEEELEAITHDKPLGTEFTIERYVHFTGHFEGNRGAKYDDVFIKLTRTIKRADVGTAKLKNQDDDYYRYEKFIDPTTGSATTYLSGFEAVAWNVQSPKDAEAPNTPTMMTVPFENNINNAFLNNGGVNRPAFDGAVSSTWKYYFTPIEVEIKGQDGNTYVLTPRRGKDDNHFNVFKCAYVGSDNNHKFHLSVNGVDKTDIANNRSTGALTENIKANEEKNNEILEQCAIKYNTGASNPANDGVFANDTLYAVLKSAYASAAEYEPIVIMNATTGAVTLLHESVDNKWNKGAQPLGGAGAENTYSEVVLNAIGYNEEVYEVGQNPIHEQLRAWTGVIVKARCNIAMKMSDVNKKDDNTFATWMNGWERPINVYTGEKSAVDAKNNGNYIYAVDFLNMYDWRGYGLDSSNQMTWDATQIDWNNQYSRRGAMFGQNYWLWAYYGIKGFTFKMKTSDIETTLHWGSQWRKLSEVSHNLEFYAGQAGGVMRKNSDVPVTFSLRTPVDYSFASKNADLIDELGFNTPDDARGYNAQKAKYGYIFYTNNGDNVQEFYLKVPVRVYYDWGWFDTKVAIKVGGTMGNLD